MFAAEIRYLWSVLRELRTALADEDWNTARQALEELEGTAMHSNWAIVCRRVADASRDAFAYPGAPGSVRRAALDAMAARFA